MRTRTAKTLAQRIDLSYFKRPHPLRRWRTLLSIAAPVIGLVWLGGLALAGSRAPYSSGPVSTAHAFAELRCEVCHVRDESFRAHVTDMACLTCHDGPAHPPSPSASAGQAPPSPPSALSAPPALSAPSAPPCATCHREHQGRVALAMTRDEFCVDCHSGSDRQASQRAEAERFPDDHPPFTTEGAKDPGTIKFNHQVHAKPDLRGPNGPEKLECVTCHQPEMATTSRAVSAGLMRPIEYEQQCTRCHPLYFDERIDAVAPHDEPTVVRRFVDRALREHIAKNPGDMSRRDGPPRRLPLNFPREVEPPARNAQDWVAIRTRSAERLLWNKTCAECHHVTAATAAGGLPTIAPANMRKQWMTRATFDHTPHLMVRCEGCHAAEQSRDTSDVLMPTATACATCHAPVKGASSQCAECHRYHDWTNARPVRPTFDLSHFQ